MSKEKFYTIEDLKEQYGLSEDLVRRYFRKPRPRLINVGGRPVEKPTWNRAQVVKGLSNPELQKAKVKEEKEKKRAEKAAVCRKYLDQFDLENLRSYAETLNRRFILHIGPTNSGKTYDSIQALMRAESGLYLGPLRLLALEMFDSLNWQNCPTNLLTGEESIKIFGAEHTASTIELCDYSRRYDVAVIDEAQMITDDFRGDKWAKAIYCVNACEVHICLAPEAEYLICDILESFNADYETVRHERLAPLKFEGIFRSLRDTQPGDALIVFSRKAVLAVAAELEQLGIMASVIYGALPPASRREEVRRFASGETTVVVATDAIGMGISLPIKRVVFCETRKFDGIGMRRLRSGEIKQIAGRAGRFGIYDMGEVLTMENDELIRDALSVPEEQVRRLTLPFPSEAVDNCSLPLDELMLEWNCLPKEELFDRANMSDSIVLYKHLRAIAGKLDRRLLYMLITCPVDIKDDRLITYWRECCYSIYRGRHLPEPFAGTDTLEECELRYKELDVRHQLLRRTGVEEDRMAEKQYLCEKINAFLEKDKDKYLKRCSRCGRMLPSTSSFGICDKCYRRQTSGRY